MLFSFLFYNLLFYLVLFRSIMFYLFLSNSILFYYALSFSKLYMFLSPVSLDFDTVKCVKCVIIFIIFNRRGCVILDFSRKIYEYSVYP